MVFPRSQLGLIQRCQQAPSQARRQPWIGTEQTLQRRVDGIDSIVEAIEQLLGRFAVQRLHPFFNGQTLQRIQQQGRGWRAFEVNLAQAR
ncbi:hypothetical protein D3C76_478190 [compost metagenome]